MAPAPDAGAIQRSSTQRPAWRPGEVPRLLNRSGLSPVELRAVRELTRFERAQAYRILHAESRVRNAPDVKSPGATVLSVCKRAPAGKTAGMTFRRTIRRFVEQYGRPGRPKPRLRTRRNSQHSCTSARTRVRLSPRPGQPPKRRPAIGSAALFKRMESRSEKRDTNFHSNSRTRLRPAAGRADGLDGSGALCLQPPSRDRNRQTRLDGHRDTRIAAPISRAAAFSSGRNSRCIFRLSTRAACTPTLIAASTPPSYA